MMYAPEWVYWLGMGSALLGGFMIRHWVGARRFNRRNSLGVEQFGGYAHLWESRIVEAGASIVAGLMLSAGLGFMLLIVARYLLLSLK